MSVCSVSIIPMGKETSISSTVSRCIRVLKRFPELKQQITPMSTQLEGSLDRLFEAIKAMHEAAFADGARRVYTTISLDDRRDKELTLAGKVASVQQKLGNQVLETFA